MVKLGLSVAKELDTRVLDLADDRLEVLDDAGELEGPLLAEAGLAGCLYELLQELRRDLAGEEVRHRHVPAVACVKAALL